MTRLTRIMALILTVLTVGFSVAGAQDKMNVTVSILPQKQFVEKIGGSLVEVTVMVSPGSAPTTYEPKPRQMVGLSRSKIYFAIGVPFENTWLDKFSAANRSMRIVHTEEGIEKIPMVKHVHAEEDDRGHEDEHEEGEMLDSHIWLSPKLVLHQARHILNALIKADPVNKAKYIDNYAKFRREVIALDNELNGLFAGRESGIEFLVFHPAWGYFAQAYGLEQIPVELEGKEPKPSEMVDLIKYAREKGIKALFVQPQIFPESASVIARAIGGEVIIADPLAGDWLNNLKNVAQKFRKVLK